MSELAIVVPVRERPQNVAPLLGAIWKTTPAARVLFVVDPDDEAECAAIRRSRRRSQLRVDVVTSAGNYASKIRAGVTATAEPFIFTGADDLKPHPGWLPAARRLLQGSVEVVGVNDLIRRDRKHATHFLMTRAYAEGATIDGNPGPFFDGYSHWYCDDELIATAKARGAYAYAPDAVVEHLHPFARKAPDDPIYELGRRNRVADRKLFEGRRALWT